MGNDVSKGKYSKMGEGSLRQQNNNNKQTIQPADSEVANSDLRTRESEIPNLKSENSTNNTNKEAENARTDIEEQATVGATIEKLKKGVYAKMNSNYEEIPTNDGVAN